MVTDVAIESRTRIAEFDGRSVEQVLFTVPSPTGTHRYQLWVGWAGYYPDRFGHVFIGETYGQYAYDALHDPDVSALVLANIADGVQVGDLSFTAGTGRRDRSDRARSGDRGGAVQHVDRLRTLEHPEGVPPAGAGPEPGCRGASGAAGRRAPRTSQRRWV